MGQFNSTSCEIRWQLKVVPKQQLRVNFEIWPNPHHHMALLPCSKTLVEAIVKKNKN